MSYLTSQLFKKQPYRIITTFSFYVMRFTEHLKTIKFRLSRISQPLTTLHYSHKQLRYVLFSTSLKNLKSIALGLLSTVHTLLSLKKLKFYNTQ